MLVATGTYGFPALARKILESMGELSERYYKVTLQCGRFSAASDAAKYKIDTIDARAGQYRYNNGPCSVAIVVREFIEDFGEALEAHDVILTHGGTGTIIEALKKGKATVSVCNRDLKEDHQGEFLDEYREYINVAELDSLPATLLRRDLRKARVTPLPSVWTAHVIPHLARPRATDPRANPAD